MLEILHETSILLYRFKYKKIPQKSNNLFGIFKRSKIVMPDVIQEHGKIGFT